MRLKISLFSALLCAFYICPAQVKIGGSTGSVNPAAILELSNEVSGAPNTWKSFLPPQVDFSNAVFTSSYVWGIAGSPTEGAIVYNITETYSNGFSGLGLYCWRQSSWVPITNVIDKIRQSLSTSIAAYDAASINNWVNVTGDEYNNLLVVVGGAARYATPEIYMNTSSGGGGLANNTIGGSNNAIQVPASNYIIAWSIRTGVQTTSSFNSKLKVSPSQYSGYTDHGSPLPDIGTLQANTRVYFVLKLPNILTPASACYTAVYNATTFLGNNFNPGAGPEYYAEGDSPSLFGSLTTDSYSQVISTPTRQW